MRRRLNERSRRESLARRSHRMRPQSKNRLFRLGGWGQARDPQRKGDLGGELHADPAARRSRKIGKPWVGGGRAGVVVV